MPNVEKQSSDTPLAELQASHL